MKALYFKSAVILKILIVLKAVQINYQRTKRIKKTDLLCDLGAYVIVSLSNVHSFYFKIVTVTSNSGQK